MSEALVSFLVQQLGSILFQQVEQNVRLVVNVKKEVLNLTLNLETIQAVLGDAERRQMKEANVRRWLNNLKEVSFDIDDVVDEWRYEILKQQIKKQGENAIIPKKTDFVQYLTKDECFSMVVKGGNERMEFPGDEVCHLSLMFAPKGPFPVSFLNCKSLCTLTAFEPKLTSIEAELISQLKSLRSLNLSENSIIEVPKEIGGLIHLRYMDLSENYQLKELPDSLGDLYNLQTLRLVGCSELVKLLDEEVMKKLTKLKHLYVDGCRRLKSKGIRGLTGMQKLD
ncbi:hypothetical protein ACLB2K_055664 [Fragaria x ananassa]